MLPPLSGEELERLVDASVSRAMKQSQSQGTPAAGSPQTQYAAPGPSPQAAYQAPPPAPYATTAAPPQYVTVQSNTTQTAQVLVPAGPLKTIAGRVGQRLAECARPRIRTMALAPVSYSYAPVPTAPVGQVYSVPVAAPPVQVYTVAAEPPYAPPAQPQPQQAAAPPPPPSPPLPAKSAPPAPTKGR
jgi:hypothetical protein